MAYEMLVGPIPKGLVIDHLCRVRNCVNPAHMEPVTMAENTYRGLSGGMDERHCARAHDYEVYGYYQQRKGKRCKECVRIYGKERYQKIKNRSLSNA